MRIQSGTIIPNYNSQPTFKSWSRDVISINKKTFTKDIVHRNDTSFFRDGKFWAQFMSFLVDRFKNVPKVNIYSYGCSDCSEVFSFIMHLLSQYDKDVINKFLPVVAKDYDEVAIDKIRRNDYHMSLAEKEVINSNTSNSYDRFVKEKEGKKDEYGEFPVELKEELFKHVKYSKADIFSDYKSIKPQNSVVFVRNFWPYIKSSYARQNLLNKLYEHLDYGSMIVIGDYDKTATDWSIVNQITKAGFRSTDMPYVYQKIKPLNAPEFVEKESKIKKLFQFFFNIFD